MEQTAVEWLVETLAEKGILHSSDIAFAKNLEKEQIEEAYGIGYTNCEVGIKYREEYYNETYNK